jgi:hypothetical protein
MQQKNEVCCWQWWLGADGPLVVSGWRGVFSGAMQTGLG